MKESVSKRFSLAARWRARACAVLAVVLAVGGGGCFSGEDGETFYGRVVVPRGQEFRWSDGGLPRVFDPARASAPPDTDAVRALFEGLTDYDPQTLQPVAGVAASWESSEGDRVWTFHLREEARWSNGDHVTAHDFVRSWQRTLRLGDSAPHSELLANLIERRPQAKGSRKGEAAPRSAERLAEGAPAAEQRKGNEASGESVQNRTERETESESDEKPAEEIKLGVEVEGEHTLRVRLQRPDKNFPSLVAHPVFRPVHASALRDDESAGVGGDFVAGGTQAGGSKQLISNGAFRLGELRPDGVVLERERNYWNAAQVALERVRFVGARDAEAALSAYRAGEVDAVTNAQIEPLGLKLLASYKDFRRSTFGALTYYDFNATRPPFDDTRVRQALARAVDRQRLSADTLEGATEPAAKFLPTRPAEQSGDGQGEESNGSEGEESPSLAYDPATARRLLAEAGYPGGFGFPRVRLLVNRNDQHRQVAEAVAEMWRTTLGVETEILLRDWDEYEVLLRTGEFDVAKRSLLMQTTDEETNIRALFAPERFNFDAAAEATPALAAAAEAATPAGVEQSQTDGRGASATVPARPPILTEAQALKEVPAIPVYFASSYALVKPYVQGFDANLLDAPSLQRVRIDTNWQPPKRETRLSLGGK